MRNEEIATPPSIRPVIVTERIEEPKRSVTALAGALVIGLLIGLGTGVGVLYGPSRATAAAAAAPPSVPAPPPPTADLAIPAPVDAPATATSAVRPTAPKVKATTRRVPRPSVPQKVAAHDDDAPPAAKSAEASRAAKEAADLDKAQLDALN